ncbi:TetR/AcrR family transcriptional regulator [Yoonia sp.]|jgi:TetR/AcrR family transcriptional regulator, mexJK operon transcriptional repressor|uniref:TetR/AcrR family transcriptional regulator n=1 Tax=Yoonia sp. TaxID=2212373 RepID=UPI004048B8A0
MSNGAETRIRQSKAKILSAAEDVFLRSGFKGANMDSVAEAAGVSKQTVYAHFRSKEALFIQVVEQMTGRAARLIGEDVADDFTGKSAEVFFLQVARDQLCSVLTPPLMRLRRMVIGEVERFPELGLSLYENGPGRSIARIALVIEHYRGVGELQCVDAEAAATMFNWLVMGGPTNCAMMLGDGALLSEPEREAHAAECVRVFIAAYGAKPAPQLP